MKTTKREILIATVNVIIELANKSKHTFNTAKTDEAKETAMDGMTVAFGALLEVTKLLLDRDKENQDSITTIHVSLN